MDVKKKKKKLIFNISYIDGIARAGASLFSELRNAVFAKVAQSSISSMGKKSS